jgi:hypothetical protein
MTMRHPAIIWSAAAACVLGACAVAAWAQQQQHLKQDSHAPYVHRINIYDEAGNIINTTAERPGLYSPVGTCGKCHEYEDISRGWHFNYADGVDHGRPGEPWIYQDPTTRTYIPLSYRGWNGTYKPSDIGLTDWRFTLAFGSHLPGGGVAAPASWATTQPATPSRWHISGKLDVDCMICHESAGTYNFNERASQIQRVENLKFAPAIAMNLGAVKGVPANAKMLPPHWNEKDAADPEKKLRPGPRIQYDHAKFEEGHTLFPIARTPKSERCYACHSNQPAVDRREFWRSERDVHMRANFECATCHRNGIDHMTVRGYETEGRERKDDFVASLSCKGCHYGVEGSRSPALALGGKYGAPVPEHRGLPTVHLEQLSCTACHSGPFPEMQPEMVQTGFAHALGVSRPGREPDAMPRIAQPIFLRGHDGKIAPHKMMWPSFWGRLKDGQVMPIDPAIVRKAGDLPPVSDNARAADKARPLTEQQISKTLEGLAADADAGEPVYIVGGRLHQRSPDGRIVAREHPAAEPYAWPLGHDVRPRAQSLGARGCADCHSEEGAIYFARVAALGPVDPDQAVVRTMYEMRGEDGMLPTLFARSFLFRPVLKFVSFGSAILLGAVLVLYGLRGLGAVLDSSRKD